MQTKTIEVRAAKIPMSEVFIYIDPPAPEEQYEIVSCKTIDDAAEVLNTCKRLGLSYCTVDSIAVSAGEWLQANKG